MGKFISVNYLKTLHKISLDANNKNLRILSPVVAGIADRLKQNKAFTFPTIEALRMH